MITIFGLIVLIAGFVVPFLSGARVPYDFFFWFGFLLLIRPNKYFPPGTSSIKCARIGLLVHVLGTLVILSYYNFVLNPSLSNSSLAYLSIRAVNYIVNPVSSLYHLIFPGEQFGISDVRILFTISLMRSTITGFLNVLLYVYLGGIIGKRGTLFKNDTFSTKN